jgi:hypothetical protein
MRMTRAVIVALLLVAFIGGSFVLAREPDSYASKVEAQTFSSRTSPAIRPRR